MPRVHLNETHFGGREALLRDVTGQDAGRRIEARHHDPDRVIEPRRFRWGFLRYYISSAIERLTGVRVFEFRNYKIVGKG